MAIRQQFMEEGGRQLWSALSDELGHIHLEMPQPARRESVIAYLQAAFEQVASVARQSGWGAPGQAGAFRPVQVRPG
jgi:hypothetical protein